MSQEKPNKRINFFDTDTSGGATAGADSFGDTRAHFTANSVKQLSEPEVETFDPVEETQLRQLDGKKSINRRVEIGKEYIVEIKNAGQGLMGNTPAPVGALKVNGGVVKLEDLPNVAAGEQELLLIIMILAEYLSHVSFHCITLPILCRMESGRYRYLEIDVIFELVTVTVVPTYIES